ncbi:MAG: hypothetical protein NT091_00770 [Candidatus Falkowbacteria bacterium]|nr:hypothetical protein [Candidatus Falkowbacteria bacterium]
MNINNPKKLSVNEPYVPIKLSFNPTEVKVETIKITKKATIGISRGVLLNFIPAPIDLRTQPREPTKVKRLKSIIFSKPKPWAEIPVKNIGHKKKINDKDIVTARPPNFDRPPELLSEELLEEFDLPKPDGLKEDAVLILLDPISLDDLFKGGLVIGIDTN